MGKPRRRRSRRAASTTLLVAGLGVVGVVTAYALGRASLPELSQGRIPPTAYQAYRAAADAAPTIVPGCSVDWTVIAGIAQVESRHGRFVPGHQLAPNGDVLPPIRGAALDGTGGTRAVPDTDGGQLDGDATWDRAMGPLQVIPSTWRELARDGNGDGALSPDNLYDAAYTAVAHLCERTPGDYSDPRALRRALLGYNASGRYADQVQRWVERYRTEPLAEVLESPAGEPPG